MITRERIASLLMMLIGTIFCISSVNLGIGSSRAPGPGFFPFLAGILIILLSGGVILEEKLSKAQVSKAPLFKGRSSAVSMSVWASLFAYSLLVNKLGFMLTTFLLMTFLFRVSEKQNMMKVVGAALLTTILAYILFDYFLEVILPAGIFR